MTFWTRWNIFQRLSFCSNKLAPDRLLWYICRLGVVTAQDFIKESACLHFSICIFMQLCNCWQESSTVVFWHCCLPAGGAGVESVCPDLALSLSVSPVLYHRFHISSRGDQFAEGQTCSLVFMLIRKHTCTRTLTYQAACPETKSAELWLSDVWFSSVLISLTIAVMKIQQGSC